MAPLIILFILQTGKQRVTWPSQIQLSGQNHGPLTKAGPQLDSRWGGVERSCRIQTPTSKLLRWNFAFPPPFPPLKQRFIFHSWGTQPLQLVAWEQRVCFKHRGAGAGAACPGKWSHGSYWHLNNTLEEGERERPVFPLSAATLWLQGMFTFSRSKVTGGNEGRSRNPRLRLEWQASCHIRTGSQRKPLLSPPQRASFPVLSSRGL